MSTPTMTMNAAAPESSRSRAAFGDLVLRMSTRFINSPVDAIGPGIETALGELGRFIGVDRAVVVVFSEHLHHPADAPLLNDVMTMAHEWRADGIVPSLDDRGRLKMQPDSSEESRRTNEWIRRQIREDNTVRWDSLDDIPAELGVLKRRWVRQSVKSRMAVPMRIEGRGVGLLGVDCVRRERRWDAETEVCVRAAAPVIAHAVLRKQNAEAIREAHATLERKVEERTRELREKQAQLVQSEKLASLGQLVAGVAHEVNTPLGAIKSNHDTTLRALRRLVDTLHDEPGQLRLLQAAIDLGPSTGQAIDRIATLVTSLRSFARLDRAEIDRVDLRIGLRSALELLRSEIEGRVDVRTHVADIPLVKCVPSQINQVFMNLLLNACQAIEREGSITVCARAEGEGVRLDFQDTGRGMAPEDLSRVFDPGFTTKGVGVGTGLGMSIVHQIVSDHRGDIGIDSAPGKGTTVTIWLPCDTSA